MQIYLKPILTYQNENQGSDCHLCFLNIYEQISGNVNIYPKYDPTLSMHPICRVKFIKVSLYVNINIKINIISVTIHKWLFFSSCFIYFWVLCHFQYLLSWMVLFIFIKPVFLQVPQRTTCIC